ncbi:hypothetical protein STPYR_13091 [uncultured Stenotrophomonas sp.]|uniref:Uncharacterized protein n=1 Tax=uncultured Stenotrophomonas sp. TaxID=165438 RepID=A0A1Y5Q7C8_9GAMM|nr:hypothetical protein STPYR_13091 [uncultured Stenotrophomonas sp.]
MNASDTTGRWPAKPRMHDISQMRGLAPARKPSRSSPVSCKPGTCANLVQVPASGRHYLNARRPALSVR